MLEDSGNRFTYTYNCVSSAYEMKSTVSKDDAIQFLTRIDSLS